MVVEGPHPRCHSRRREDDFRSRSTRNVVTRWEGSLDRHHDRAETERSNHHRKVRVSQESLRPTPRLKNSNARPIDRKVAASNIEVIFEATHVT